MLEIYHYNHSPLRQAALARASINENLGTPSSMEVRSSGKRPPSYSDSFLFLPEASEPLVLRKIDTNNNHNNTSLSLNSFSTAPEQTPSIPYTTCERWNSRILSFSLHILLISLFETLFFFLFVSKTEDSGLQNALDGYIASTLATCTSWSPNTTLFVNDILSLLLNATAVQEQGQAAAIRRHQFNDGLQWIGWSYTTGLATLFVSQGIGACACNLRIAWKRILVENSIMIALLGLYETMFFRTIIYNYKNLTEAELTAFLVGQLQTTCGLL